MLDWDLIRYFLAVARGGSAQSASRELRQSQPTVTRKIATLEHSLGVKLFDRTHRGFELTEEGEALFGPAESVERATRGFVEGAGAAKRGLSGAVRLTCGEMVASHHLAPILSAFREAYPDIRVDVRATDAFLDLTAGEADVAIRAVAPGTRTDDAAGLVMRKVGRLPRVVYCSRGYAEARGCPRTADELGGHDLVGGEGALADAAAIAWLERAAPPDAVVARANTLPSLIANLRAGVGLCVLPASLLDDDPEVVTCFVLPPDLDSQLYLVTHERVRRLARVRALLNFLADHLGDINRRQLLPARDAEPVD